MSWVISKQHEKTPYFLKQVPRSGQAVWTPLCPMAIEFSAKHVAEYVIHYAKIKGNVEIREQVNGSLVPHPCV